jgi:hypothetical protein
MAISRVDGKQTLLDPETEKYFTTTRAMFLRILSRPAWGLVSEGSITP